MGTNPIAHKVAIAIGCFQLQDAKWHLMQELMYFNALILSIATCSLLYSFKFQGGGRP